MPKYRLIQVLLLLLVTTIGYGQDFNLDYEVACNNSPSSWNTNCHDIDGISCQLDSTIRKSGKYSLRVLSDLRNKVVTSYHKLPNTFKGRTITLSGYIRTDKLEGFAGLWLEMQPNNTQETMFKNGPRGTSEWKEYSITMPLYGDTIIFGTMSYGKGCSWFDKLSLEIDGKIVFEKNKPQFSDISIKPTENNLYKLYRVCHVWGTLKYYHPQIRKGNFDMDSELSEFLNNNFNKEDFDKELYNWTLHFGNDIILPSPAYNKKMKDNMFQSLVCQIRKLKCDDESNNNYVSFQEKGNLRFNERAYSNIYPNTFHRILALFRYWNAIRYFYPYLEDKEQWNSVLRKYLPLFIKAGNTQKYKDVVLRLTAELNDSHVAVANTPKILNYGGNRILSPEFCFVGDTLVVKSNIMDNRCNKESLLPGDMILAINNNETKSIVKTLSPYISASNPTAKYAKIASILRYTNNKTSIKFIRDGKTKDILLDSYSIDSLYRYSFSNPNDTCFKIINDSIAYLNVSTVKKQSFDSIWNNIKDKKGLIIDLRYYPQYFLIQELGKHLVEKVTPFYRAGTMNPNCPGEIQRVIPSSAYLQGSKETFYPGKTIILVGQETGSRGEFAAMAFSANPNTVIIGSETMGADGDIESIWLPGGIKTFFSGIEICYPNGKPTQKVGIVPNINIKKQVSDFREQKDPVLNKAIEYLSNH